MQKAQQRSLKPRALPDRGTHNRQRPLSSSSASSTPSPPGPPSTTVANAKGKGGGNVDKLLFKNLVEMVPLVQTLMDKKPNPAFTRRASMVHTPAPPQVKKVSTTKPIKGTRSVSAKKQKDPSEIGPAVKKEAPRGVRPSASKPLISRNLKKEIEELAMLQGQVSELEKKLVDKEAALKSAQSSIEQMSIVNETLEDVRRQLDEKELMVKSASSDLNHAKIALADKQAALEKLEWEGKMSSLKVEELKGNVADMSDEISVLMEVFEKLSPDDSAVCSDDESDSPLECEPIEFEDDIGEVDMAKMEEEIAAYLLALAAARDNPDEKLLDIVAQERLRLQALVLSS